MQTRKWPEHDQRQHSAHSINDNVPIKTGLRRKFIITISLLIVSVSMAFFVFYFYSTKIILTDLFNQENVQKSEKIAAMIASNAPNLEQEKLNFIADTLLQSEELIYIIVLDKNNKTLVKKSIQPDYFPKAISVSQLDNQVPRIKPEPITGLGEIKDVLTPIYPSNLMTQHESKTAIGYFRIGINYSKNNKVLYHRSIWLLIGCGFFILLGVVLALYLYKIIISPIQQMARAMKVVAEGDLAFDDNGLPAGKRFRRGDDLNLNIHSNDEIEQLADEFAVMVNKLETSYTQLEAIIKEKTGIANEKSQLAEALEKLNRQHEEVIKERTREIVEKNLRLYEISEELQFQKEELIGTNEDLEKISRMKSEFLANMSHELRTPLNAIIGFAEVLKDKMFGDINERQEKYLNNIVTSGKHLLNLINGILDISKVEAGKMSLTIETYAVNKVIDEVQTIIKTLAYKKNIRIRMMLCHDLVVDGDPARFKQILYNLLSNAIKFTDEKGSIIVYTTEIAEGVAFPGAPGCQPFSVEEPCFMVAVKDSGIGIHESDQERIFNEFEQLEQTSRRQYEGTGLGLPLTKQLVHLHGGRIWIESKLGEGTCVYVVMPVKTQPIIIDPEEETP